MDNIETGNNIEQEIYRTIDMEYETKLKANPSVDKLLQKKWVSLEWLKKEIQREFEQHKTVFDFERKAGLIYILDLLEKHSRQG